MSVDLYPVILEAGDVLMLCSDGLSNLVSSEQMATVIGQADLPLSERADRLLQLALLAGGDDNITVALFEMPAGPLSVAEEGVES